jgi:hypothetical protein
MLTNKAEEGEDLRLGEDREIEAHAGLVTGEKIDDAVGIKAEGRFCGKDAKVNGNAG